MQPPEGVSLTLIVDQPLATYSGMVPALVAGEVQRHELEIDVRPLARRAGAQVIVSALTRVDADARLLHVADGRPPIPYDLASLDIGATVAGTDLPGVVDHAVPTRPIGRFIDRLDGALQGWTPGQTVRAVVVGGGAGGVELAACLITRLTALGVVPQITLVSSDPQPLPGQSDGVRSAVADALTGRGVTLLGGARVASVSAAAVTLEDGRTLPAELVVWVAGAAALPVARASGLPVDEAGFVQIRDTLQVQGHDRLFAVGDCARMVDAPWVPRAGVYAVRMGPVLADNLERALAGSKLATYTPQRDFLSMLNLGDGTALVAKWGRAAQGSWVWRWKDRIDRAFMARFVVLGPDGDPQTPFGEALPPMSGDDMVCGGCAAKVDPVSLEAMLSGLGAAPTGDVRVGLAARDDAALVGIGNQPVAVSVDGFPPFTDDPWLVGQVAVINACSDLLAKGVRPSHALLLLRGPDTGDMGLALAGVQHALRRTQVDLVGGHTASGEDLFVGLTVLGAPGPRWWSLDGARPGDVVVLTGPVGSGVLWRADALGLARGPWIEAWVQATLGGRGRAVEVAAQHDVHAATDITGFGLAGHLAEVASASGVTLTLDAASVPRFDGVDALMARGLRSTAHPGNAAAQGVALKGPGQGVDHVFDPQTAGPLAFVVPAAVAPALVADLVASGHDHACVVARVAALEEGVSVWVTGGST